jgi:hypothetical protein
MPEPARQGGVTAWEVENFGRMGGGASGLGGVFLLKLKIWCFCCKQFLRNFYFLLRCLSSIGWQKTHVFCHDIIEVILNN